MQYEFMCKTKFLSGDKALERLTYDLTYYNSSRALVVVDDKYYRTGIYRNFRKAMINCEVQLDDVRVDRNLPAAELIDIVIKRYYSDDCNAIIVLGDFQVVDIAKLARIAVSQGLHSFAQLSTMAGGVNNIPLIVVQCGYGSKNAASNRAVYINAKGMSRVENGSELAPNAVVFDYRMALSNKELSIENGLYAMASALSAVIDKKSNSFNRGFAITAIKLAHSAIFDKKMKQKERKVALLSAVAYAGIEQDSSDDGALGKLSYIISKTYKVNYKSAYYIIAPHALDMYVNKNSLNNTDLLAALVGNDAAIAVDPEERTATLIKTLMERYAYCDSKQLVHTKLAQLDIIPEDLDKIFDNGVSYNYFVDDPDIRRSVIELLSRAL